MHGALNNCADGSGAVQLARLLSSFRDDADPILGRNGLCDPRDTPAPLGEYKNALLSYYLRYRRKPEPPQLDECTFHDTTDAREACVPVSAVSYTHLTLPTILRV